jgi:hypothetical protein
MRRSLCLIGAVIVVSLTSVEGAFATACRNVDKPASAPASGAFYPGTSTFSIEIPCPAQLNGSPDHGVQGPAPGVCV